MSCNILLDMRNGHFSILKVILWIFFWGILHIFCQTLYWETICGDVLLVPVTYFLIKKKSPNMIFD